jgi:hypothetical protein
MPKNLILGLSLAPSTITLQRSSLSRPLLMRLNEKIKGGDRDLTQRRHHSRL